MDVSRAKTRSCSRGSDTAAAFDPNNFAEAVLSLNAEAKQVCGEFLNDALGQLMGEIDVLLQKIETQKANVAPLFTGLVSRRDSLEQRYARAVAAQTESDGQVKNLREKVSSLMVDLAGTAHELDLRFARTTERSSKHEEALLEQQC